LELLEDTV